MTAVSFRQATVSARAPYTVDVSGDPHGWVIERAEWALRAADAGVDPDPALLNLLAGVARWAAAHSTDPGTRGIATAALRAFDRSADRPRQDRRAA